MLINVVYIMEFTLVALGKTSTAKSKMSRGPEQLSRLSISPGSAVSRSPPEPVGVASGQPKHSAPGIQCKKSHRISSGHPARHAPVSKLV